MLIFSISVRFSSSRCGFHGVLLYFPRQGGRATAVFRVQSQTLRFSARFSVIRWCCLLGCFGVAFLVVGVDFFSIPTRFCTWSKILCSVSIRVLLLIDVEC